MARTSSLTVALILLVCSTGLAQIPLGNVAVMTSAQSPGSGTAIISVNPATGAQTVVTGMSAALTAAAQNIEIDLLSGDIFVGSSSTSAAGVAEIHRLALSGLNIVSETLVLSLPGTSGTSGVRSMERQADGSILILCDNGGNAPVLFRMAATELGQAVTQIPVTAPPSMYLSLTADAAGNIYTCDWFPGNGFSSTVYSVPPTGGTFAPTGQSIPFAASDLRFDFAGSGIHAGGLPTALLGPNYFCGGTPFTYGPTSPPFSDVVQAIGRTVGSPQMYVASAAGGVGATLWSMNGCATPGTLITTFPGQSVASVIPSISSFNYGAGCPNTTGLIAEISTVGVPMAGGTWTLALANGVPGGIAFCLFGTNPVNPFPLPGAPGCFLLTPRQITLVASTSAAGTANVTFNLDPSLAGTRVTAQWALRNGGLNPLGIATSAAIAADL